MKRHLIFTTIAAAAIVAAAPSLAGPGGGGGSGHGGGMGGGWGAGGSHGGMVGSSGGWGAGGFSRNGGFTTGTATRIHSNRSGNSATRTRSGLHANSGLGNVKLTGVNDGMTVVDTGGLAVGTVTNVFTKGNGSIRAVQVTLADGRIVTLAPSSLTLNNGTLTTTSLVNNVRSQGANHANINALVNANQYSALSLAGVTTLPGIATGLTVNNSAGAPIGTISQLYTNKSGALVGIQVTQLDGSTVIVPATTLSMNGMIVFTNSTQF